ncbi:MAG: transcriptional repressor [Bacteroidales bacterium]|nr:transcriptional repressor [Bacteroidales bacterium]
MESDEEKLKLHEIRPTSVRILVWRAIKDKCEAFALSDVENWLPDLDRSSIFRSLRLMAEKHLLHELEDGTGVCKYCVCRCHGEHHINHVHFTCIKCNRTFCISDCQIPVVSLPSGFHASDIEYIIKGVCPNCSKS